MRILLEIVLIAGEQRRIIVRIVRVGGGYFGHLDSLSVVHVGNVNVKMSVGADSLCGHNKPHGHLGVSFNIRGGPMGPVHIHRELQAVAMGGFRGKFYGIVDEAIPQGMAHVPGKPDHSSNISAASGLRQRGFHIRIVMQPSRTED